MTDLLDLLFFINVGFIATHELDAIHRHEWRIFPLTAPLPNDIGYLVFVALHIPLFAAIIWFARDASFQIGFDVFLVLHAVAHGLYRKHPLNRFDNWFSQTLIVGVVPLAVLHGVLSL